MRTLLTVGVLVATTSMAHADPINCSLRDYKAASGLTATAEPGGVSVTWNGEQGAELRMRLAVDGGQPMVRELATRASNGRWAILGQDLKPQLDITSGRRRIGFDQLNPMRELGMKVTPEVYEKEKWNAFWDAPLNVPGLNAGPFAAMQKSTAPEILKLMDLPRRPEEIKRASAVYAATACEVKTNGARLEVTFPGVSAGVFNSGRLVYTVYKGTNLIRQEVIAKTDEPSVAYKYAAGLKGFSAVTQRVRWRDTGGDWQKYEFGGTVNASPVVLRARNRVATVEGPGGSIAVFPPPHKFFFSRELEINLGYVWYRKDDSNTFSIGVRHADREENFRPLGVEDEWLDARINQSKMFVGGNFALYNAPPGTWQRMAAYFYVSPKDAVATQDAVLAFTHNDRYKPVPGYYTMTTHYHSPFTMELRDQNNLDYQSPWIPAIRARGVNIVLPSDFHADGHMTDPGPVRLSEQHDLFEASKRHADKDFAIIPFEEPHQWLGGHWNVFFPKPVYWVHERKDGQPLVDEHPRYGTVYHVGSTADMMEVLRREHGVVWLAHQRTKSTVGYPEAIKDKDFFRSADHVGGEYRPNVPTDLSEARMCEIVCFGALDDMNNWTATTTLPAKTLVAATDTYMKWPDDDVYPEEYVNYMKLDKMPRFEEGWAPLVEAVRKGEFFVTSGEVLIKDFKVEGRGNQRTITTDIEWTFPLEFVEVVWGDGTKTDRQIIPATDLQAFGTKRFSIPFDATGKNWVRVAAWDSAGNGAFVQPVRLAASPLTTSSSR